MNIKDYVDSAARTEYLPVAEVRTSFTLEDGGGGAAAQYSTNVAAIVGARKVRLLHSALGMATEIVELQDAIEKVDRVAVLEELGDVLWYWAVAIKALDFEPDRIQERDEQLLLPAFETERRLIGAICRWGDLVRRYAIHNRDPNPAQVWVALEDIWASVGDLCRSFGMSRQLVMERNIEKLKTRYPQKYETARFDERDLPAERKVLESSDQGPTEVAIAILLAASPEERSSLRCWNQGVASYCVELYGHLSVYVAESDLRDRCICSGLPPGPSIRGRCPKHPTR
jgi:hypothetical protein